MWKLTRQRLHEVAGQHFEGIVKLHEGVTNCWSVNTVIEKSIYRLKLTDTQENRGTGMIDTNLTFNITIVPPSGRRIPDS